MITKKLIVPWDKGLHARPAAYIVENLQKVNAEATARYKQKTANMNSFLNLVLLGAGKNDEIIIEAEGSDAEKAILVLEKIFKG